MSYFSIIPDQQTPITPEITDIKQYIGDNLDVLKDFLWFASTCSNAVGLAGNQTAYSDGDSTPAKIAYGKSENRFMHRVFALRNLKDKSWRLIINPVITEYYGIKELKDEGCLTWKGKRIIAERSRFVKVSYHDIDGNFFENEIYKGFEAQIWQHEVNHLNGVEERIEELSFKLPKEKEVGRNEDCPCGSGKKYKKCCILN